MMKIKKRIVTVLAVSAIVILGLFVSCSDNIMDEAVVADDKLVWATFGNGNSRGDVVESTYTQTFELKDASEVYWTYTATKTAGDKGGKTGVTTTETPVQSNFGQGLDDAIGPFSQGKWDFNICGYVGEPSDSAPTSGSLGKDYFEVKKTNSDGTKTTKYYSEKIYYGSVSGVTLSTGTATNPDPINVIINIVTEGKGTFAITNTSTFRWQKDNGDNPDNMYMKIERKTEDGTIANPEYIKLTAEKTSDDSGNYYYYLPAAVTSIWDAGYWTVNCSVVQATNTEGSYTDIYTYAESPDLLIKIYAGQTTNLDAQVIEGNLAYGKVYIKVVDGVASTTVTKEVVADEATVLSSSLTPASAASNVTKIDTSKSTKVTVPSTVQEFQASKDIAEDSSETVTASLTVTATPVEAANKNFVVSSSSGVAVNAIDLKASVKRTVTNSEGSSETTETQVNKFTSDGTTAVPVIVDTYVEAGQKDVVISYTYASDYETEDLRGKTETWNAIDLPSDYSEEKAEQNLTVPDTTTGKAGVCYYDSSSGRLIFKTTHFSTFVVSSKVEAVNKTTGSVYKKFGEAVAAAGAGETVALLNNVTLESSVAVSRELTLDMNFYKLSGEEIELETGGILAVKDSSNKQSTDFVNGTVAKVGSLSVADGVYCTSFEDALNASSSGDTINVLDTVTLKKSLTIDLNRKTVIFADGKNIVIEPYDASALADTTVTKTSIDVSIKNGKIDGQSGVCSVIKMCSYVNLTLDAVDIKADKIGNGNALILLAIGSYNAKLTVQNGCNLAMTGTYGVGTNATTGADVEIIVKDSKISANNGDGDSVGLFVTVPAKVTIEKSVISGERVGVLLRGISSDSEHKATITNSTIESTGSGTYEKYENTNWGTGTAVPAAAIVIGNKLPGSYTHLTTVAFCGTVNLSHASSDAVDICVYCQDSKKEQVKVDGVDSNWSFNDDFGYANVKTLDNYYCVEREYTLRKNWNKMRLVQDITLSEKWVNNSKYIELDLAGRKITNASSFNCKDGMISITKGKKLTIIDTVGGGSVEATATADSDGLGACFRLDPLKSQYPTLEIGGGTFKAPTYVVVANGDSKDWGTEKYYTNVCISGGTFEVSDGPVIYQPQYGFLKITGGKLTGGESAVEVRAGSVTITGGEFISTSDTYECKSNDSGTTTEGAAVAVSQHTTLLPITVTISGGTFRAEKQLVVVNPENNEVKYTKNVRVIVEPGVDMKADKIVGYKTGNSTGVDGTYYVDYKSAVKDGANLPWDDDMTVATSWYSVDETEFTLTNASQLAGLAKLVNDGNDFSGKTILLGDDIDLNSKDWTPIGLYENEDGSDALKCFSGTFDGQNHEIKGLRIVYEAPASSYRALFGYVNGTVRNFTVRGEISACDSSGVVAALESGGTIENVTSYVNVTVKASYEEEGQVRGKAAGIVVAVKNKKVADNPTYTIKGCKNYGNITVGATGASDCVGGILAYCCFTGLTIEDCENHGDISSQSLGQRLGGIVGLMQNTITATVKGCTNDGNITGTSDDQGRVSHIGDIIGSVENGVSGTMSDCTTRNGKKAIGLKSSSTFTETPAE